MAYALVVLYNWVVDRLKCTDRGGGEVGLRACEEVRGVEGRLAGLSGVCWREM